MAACARSAWCGKKTDQDAEAMGRSGGGLSTKIHAAVDALGNPVRLLRTPGQASEYGQAQALIEGFTPEAVLADKGYDSDAFIELSNTKELKRSFLQEKPA